MKKIKATLKAGQRLMANFVDDKYMIANGAWLLPANVVTVPKQLECLITTRTKFNAYKDRIDTENVIDLGRAWQPEKEMVGVMEETRLITLNRGVFYRWLICDTGKMHPVDNAYYEAIKPWFPYWLVGDTKCFYFSAGEGREPAGKLMGLNAVAFSATDVSHLGGLLRLAGG